MAGNKRDFGRRWQGSDSDDCPMLGEVTRAALAIEDDGPSRYIDEEIKSPGEFSHQGA